MSEYMLKLVTIIVGTVLSALIIAVFAGVWSMSGKIQELDMSREIWQQRVTSQLEHINNRVNGAYTSTDAREDRIKTEQVLNEQRRMIRNIEGKLEILQEEFNEVKE